MDGLYNYKVDKVISVYDGDTMTVDIDLGFGMIMKKRALRFYGINTPELRGGTEETKQAGRDARDLVRELVEEADQVYIKSYYDKSGKYGRILASVILVDAEGHDVNLNELLVAKGHAVEYMKK